MQRFWIICRLLSIAGLSVSTLHVLGQGAATPSSEVDLPAGGAFSSSTLGDSGPTRAGYAYVKLNSGDQPFGTAVFSLRQNGVVVSEAGVPSSPPTRRARIFVDYREAALVPPASRTVDVNTGVAVVNLTTGVAVVTYALRDLTGRILATGYGIVDPGTHHARFIDKLDVMAPNFNLPGDFATNTRFGTLEISSDHPVSVLALRQTTNQRGEALFTTTPIADMTLTPSSRPTYFPQFVDGGGYTTSLLLVNTTETAESGTIEIMNDLGMPLVTRMSGGAEGSDFRYSIPPGGALRMQTDGSPADVRIGWAMLTPDAGTYAPSTAGVFSYTQGGVLVTESGIPASAPTTHARIFVDRSAGHDTGLAVANTGLAPSDIEVSALQADGTPLAGNNRGTLQLAAKGHAGRFAGELVNVLNAGFTGVLDISSASPFVALTLRSLTNGQNDFLLTTFPTVDLTQPAPALLVFPQIADGGGYITEFIFVSAGSTASAILNYYDESGQPWPVGPVR